VAATPLSYAPTRSIFTNDQRFEQLQQSLASIRTHDPDPTALIVWAEVSHLTDEQLQQAYIITNQYWCSFVDFSNEPEVANQVASPFKGPTELLVLQYLVTHNSWASQGITHLLKLSGRYCLTSDFDAARLAESKYTLVPDGTGAVSTVLYAVPRCLWDDFQERLARTLQITQQQGISIENVLFREDDPQRANDLFHPIPRIGAAGFVSPTGEWLTI
jgi:hypothetical protein